MSDDEIKRPVQIIIAAILICWVIIGFVFGSVKTTDWQGCKYASIAAFTNPGYWIGCEFFKDRTR